MAGLLHSFTSDKKTEVQPPTISYRRLLAGGEGPERQAPAAPRRGAAPRWRPRPTHACSTWPWSRPAARLTPGAPAPPRSALTGRCSRSGQMTGYPAPMVGADGSGLEQLLYDHYWLSDVSPKHSNFPCCSTLKLHSREKEKEWNGT